MCQQCQRIKAAKLIYTEAGRMPIVTRPLERIQVDVMGPYPKSRQKNRFIIVAVNAFSRHIMAKAVPQARSIETINFLQDLINRYGLPQTIQTDNGKNFVSQQFKDFIKKYTIRHITSALYNPKTQGLVERTNRTLSDRLRIYTKDSSEWDTKLGEIVFAINTKINKITKETPFYLMHGFEPRTILDNQWNLTSQVDPQKRVKRRRLLAELRSQQNQEKDYSLRSQRKGTAKLEIGDLVLWQVRNINRKLGKHLSPKFKGPYVVVGLNNKGNVVVVNPRSRKKLVLNKNQIRKYFGNKPNNYEEILRNNRIKY